MMLYYAIRNRQKEIIERGRTKRGDDSVIAMLREKSGKYVMGMEIHEKRKRAKSLLWGWPKTPRFNSSAERIYIDHQANPMKKYCFHEKGHVLHLRSKKMIMLPSFHKVGQFEDSAAYHSLYYKSPGITD